MDLAQALQDPRSGEWGDPPLPERFTAFRPHQQQAITEIVAAFDAGAHVVVLEAPTGSGKTLVGEAVRRALSERALYMCVDRGLQDQVVEDYSYARVLKGRRNYPTLDFPQEFEGPEHLSADDCTGKKCKLCASNRAQCPYKVAKARATGAKLACVNTAYFLAECNGPGAFSGWPLIIADEGDRLESVLMNYVEVSIGERRLFDWGLRVPQVPFDQDPIPDLTMWLTGPVRAAILRDLAQLGTPQGEGDDEDVRTRRRRRGLENLLSRVDNLVEDLPHGGWVSESRRGGIVFKAVKVDHVADALLWQHGQKWLVMSATVLSPGRMLRDLGVTDQWAVVRMPSSFPVANRPIYVNAVANVVKKEEDTAIPKVAAEVEAILGRHPNERVLVHAVSFRLLQGLRTRLGRNPRTVWYEGSDGRAGTLEAYLDKPNGVLVAPALERGLDLPDDACRVVVIAKVPWPDLGDAQVRARQALDRDWYIDTTLRSLVQMTGRGVRHERDHCVTYILDAQFTRVFNQYRSRLPAWWRDAVVA